MGGIAREGTRSYSALLLTAPERSKKSSPRLNVKHREGIPTLVLVMA